MLRKQLFFRKNPLFDKCPSCGHINSLRRSHARNLKESFIKHFTIYKIYRCRNCGWRGYLSTLIITNNSIKNLLLYLLIALATGGFIYEVLSRFIK